MLYFQSTSRPCVSLNTGVSVAWLPGNMHVLWIIVGNVTEGNKTKHFSHLWRVVYVSAVYCSSLDRAVEWLSAH